MKSVGTQNIAQRENLPNMPQLIDETSKIIDG